MTNDECERGANKYGASKEHGQINSAAGDLIVGVLDKVRN